MFDGTLIWTLPDGQTYVATPGGAAPAGQGSAGTASAPAAARGRSRSCAYDELGGPPWRANCAAPQDRASSPPAAFKAQDSTDDHGGNRIRRVTGKVLRIHRMKHRVSRTLRRSRLGVRVMLWFAILSGRPCGLRWPWMPGVGLRYRRWVLAVWFARLDIVDLPLLRDTLACLAVFPGLSLVTHQRPSQSHRVRRCFNDCPR
jgi:hypothetical protein